jgi:hypothetical protein
MDRYDRAHRQRRIHRFTPSSEGLESRRLPSFFGAFSNSSSQVAYQSWIVGHEYDQYVGELKRLELASRATPAEYLALRDDARALSAAASGAGLPRSVVQLKAVEASLELDRAPLYGWLGDDGWSGVSARLTTDLAGLHVPQPLIDQTISDMRSLAVSAGVGPDGFATFTDDFNMLRTGEQTLPRNSGYHFRDPALYYTQHLRGFFRGWGVQKIEAEARVQEDLRTIPTAARTGPDGVAVVQRDVKILEGLGAAMPSASKNQFNSTYLAAFAQGTPTPGGLAQLRSSLVGILGPAGTAHPVASVDRLVADAPGFYQAVGASQPDVETILTDVGMLVDAGGGESLNPFKITIQPGYRSDPAG